MRNTFRQIALAGVAATSMGAGMAVPAEARAAQHTVMVGGAAMYPSRNIVENAVNSRDHTTLVAAVQAAGLVDTLSGRRAVHRLRAH